MYMNELKICKYYFIRNNRNEEDSRSLKFYMTSE